MVPKRNSSVLALQKGKRNKKFSFFRLAGCFPFILILGNLNIDYMVFTYFFHGFYTVLKGLNA